MTDPTTRPDPQAAAPDADRDRDRDRDRRPAGDTAGQRLAPDGRPTDDPSQAPESADRKVSGNAG